jgi:hypothetical protein
VILPQVALPQRCNKHYTSLGIDSFFNCLDSWHYIQYPHRIEYHFNSRGFRDSEWPSDLITATWCLGDSFTLGVGSPVEHTWPQQLNQPGVNISMDGASCAWIARQACHILQLQPRNMIILWSFFERREAANTTVSDLDRRMPPQVSTDQDHFDYFLQCYRAVEQLRGSTNIVHAFVPGHYPVNNNTADQLWHSIADPAWGPCPASVQQLDQLPEFVQQELIHDHDCWHKLRSAVAYRNMYSELHSVWGEVVQIDRARDGFHFDIATARAFATEVLPLLR